jgi:hypothetical protein
MPVEHYECLDSGGHDARNRRFSKFAAAIWKRRENGNRCRSDLAVLCVILYSAWGLIQDKVPVTAPFGLSGVRYPVESAITRLSLQSVMRRPGCSL